MIFDILKSRAYVQFQIITQFTAASVLIFIFKTSSIVNCYLNFLRYVFISLSNKNMKLLYVVAQLPLYQFSKEILF